METAGDTILTEFFNDWFYSEGFPIYSAEYKNAGDGFYQISLSQTPSHTSVSFFEVPVPVRFYNEGKTDSVDFRLDNTHNYQEFTVKINFPVASMKIDPDLWLISKTDKITGSSSIETNKVISVFPNPVNDKFSVILPVGQQFKSISIYSYSGQLQKEFRRQETFFDIRNLSSGVYFLLIETNSEISVQKIVKH
jgi:hypothetical protein